MLRSLDEYRQGQPSITETLLNAAGVAIPDPWDRVSPFEFAANITLAQFEKDSDAIHQEFQNLGFQVAIADISAAQLTITVVPIRDNSPAT